MSRYGNYEIKNNVFGELYAPISSLATNIQVKDGEGGRFAENMVATLENIENGKVMKREIVLITAINGDILTVVRKYAPCPANDESNAQGQVSFAFSADDVISAYITKEHFTEIEKGFQNTNMEIDGLNLTLDSDNIKTTYDQNGKLIQITDLKNNVVYNLTRNDQTKQIEIQTVGDPKKYVVSYDAYGYLDTILYS